MARLTSRVIPVRYFVAVVLTGCNGSRLPARPGRKLRRGRSDMGRLVLGTLHGLEAGQRLYGSHRMFDFDQDSARLLGGK